MMLWASKGLLLGLQTVMSRWEEGRQETDMTLRLVFVRLQTECLLIFDSNLLLPVYCLHIFILL